VVAVAPFALAWLLLTDDPPAFDFAVARGAMTLAALTVLAGAYIATVSLLAATNVPDQRAAGAVLAATVAVVLTPAWAAARRRLLARAYGPGRTPGWAYLDLSHQLRTPSDADALLEAVAGSVARAVRSPSAAILLSPEPAVQTPFEARVPLVLGDRRLGTLVVVPRRSGERFTRADLRMLDGLAPQVALVVEAVLLGRRLATAERQTLLLREQERRQIHADLHDTLGPLLAGLGMHVAAVSGAAATQSDMPARLVQISAVVEECQSEVRRLVRGLSPVPQRRALGSAVRDLVHGWQSAAGEDGLKFEAAVDDVPAATADIETALQRVAGEAVTNVVRHAQAAWCRVSLTTQGRTLVLTVEDDGRGIGSGRPGVGLTSMRSRIEHVGGTLTIVGRQPVGTTVTAQAPYQRELG
jgi:two-component system, NarL family, sensor kinase